MKLWILFIKLFTFKTRLRKVGLDSRAEFYLLNYFPLGEQVAELVKGFKEVGVHTINFNAESVGAGLQSGLYIYKFESNGLVQSRKMTLIK